MPEPSPESQQMTPERIQQTDTGIEPWEQKTVDAAVEAARVTRTAPGKVRLGPRFVRNFREQHGRYPEPHELPRVAGGADEEPPTNGMSPEMMAAMFSLFGGEGQEGPIIEGLRSREPAYMIRSAMELCELWEEDPKYFKEWVAEQYVGGLMKRRKGLETFLPYVGTALAVKYGRDKLLTERERTLPHDEQRALVEQRRNAASLAYQITRARSRLLETLGAQRSKAGDIKSYAQLFFTGIQANVQSNFYGVIGEMPPINDPRYLTPEEQKIVEEVGAESLKRQGLLMDRAMRGLIDMAEGRFYPDKPGEEDPIDFELLGNPFTKTSNCQLYIEEDKYLKRFYTDGSQGPITLARNMIEHFDINVTYGLAKAPAEEGSVTLARLRATGRDLGANPNNYLTNPNRAVLLTEDRRGLNTSDTSNDTAKAVYISYRQEQESDRPIPRAVCPPAIIGCIPMIMTDFMRMIKVKEKDGTVRPLWDYWRGVPTPEAAESTQPLDPEDDSLWIIKPLEFKDLPWDKQKHSVGGHDFVDGISTFEFMVPYGLEKMYAGTKVYEFFMSTDFMKMGQEFILHSQSLHELNKAFTASTYDMWTKMGMKDTTAMKLSVLAEVLGMAGWAIANTFPKEPIPSTDLLKWYKDPKVNPDKIKPNAKDYLSEVMAAMVQAGSAGTILFGKDREKFKLPNGQSLKHAALSLLIYLVRERRLGVKPSFLSLDEHGRPYFKGYEDKKTGVLDTKEPGDKGPIVDWGYIATGDEQDPGAVLKPMKVEAWFTDEEIKEINNFGLFAPDTA